MAIAARLAIFLVANSATQVQALVCTTYSGGMNAGDTTCGAGVLKCVQTKLGSIIGQACDASNTVCGGLNAVDGTCYIMPGSGQLIICGPNAATAPTAATFASCPTLAPTPAPTPAPAPTPCPTPVQNPSCNTTIAAVTCADYGATDSTDGLQNCVCPMYAPCTGCGCVTDCGAPNLPYFSKISNGSCGTPINPTATTSGSIQATMSMSLITLIVAVMAIGSS
mmetsp:Transcript_35713/g.64203  ORF Transcript_35713/g.64203 Transcript_35713/m.64203 type:complete len:223 (+) Transcript_35713:60-728(+)